jgi:HSP20 family molecular chaperone IbpA
LQVSAIWFSQVVGIPGREIGESELLPTEGSANHVTMENSRLPSHPGSRTHGTFFESSTALHASIDDENYLHFFQFQPPQENSSISTLCDLTAPNPPPLPSSRNTDQAKHYMLTTKLTSKLPLLYQTLKPTIISTTNSFIPNLKALPIQATRKMSLFPFSEDFTPLFRLLDDYDSHRSSTGSRSQTLRAFQPKFDVREEKGNYILHGELPGIDQKDIDISFTDAQTLVIKGHTEREYHEGTPPSHQIENGEQQKQIEGGEQKSEEKEHTQVAKHEKKEKEQHQYWLSERSVGEFHRSFTFPNKVDQDAVKASLKNGILSVTVPKVQESKGKKITIELKR